jgi:hypothetical protein
MAILYTGAIDPLPINPKMRMKMNGKTKLKITAEGLRKIARRLALVMASMALV